MTQTTPVFRLIHFSDAHLGKISYGFEERLRDMGRALCRVADAAIEHGADLVLDTGDTFDSPEPDPWSVKCYREFLERLHDAGIPYVGIVGNHDCYKQQSWGAAASGHVERPISTAAELIVARYSNRSKTHEISLAAADWMPRAQLAEFLAKHFPDGGQRVDVLALHQSCEGFLPKVAAHEMELAQASHAAHYVAVGDTHVVRTLSISEDSIISSAGPIEMTNAGEDFPKSVNLVMFAKGEKLPKVTLIPLKNRPFVKATVAIPIDLEMLKTAIQDSIAKNCEPPLVLVSHRREMERELKELRERLKTSVPMFRLTPMAEISGETYETGRMEMATDMEGIIRETLASHPELQNTAVDLYRNPKNCEKILDHFRSLLKTQQTQAAAPAPAPSL